MSGSDRPTWSERSTSNRFNIHEVVLEPFQQIKFNSEVEILSYQGNPDGSTKIVFKCLSNVRYVRFFPWQEEDAMKALAGENVRPVDRE